jgi:cytochrome b561
MAVASQARFSGTAIVLHWLIATLIVWNLYLGFEMQGLSSGGPGLIRVDLFKVGDWSLGWTTPGASALLRKFQIFQLHKSLGFSILALSLLRVGVRLTVQRPPPTADLRPWERALASLVHWGFYVAMIALPLTGWVIVSASLTNIPTLLFKAIPVAHLALVHGLEPSARRMIEDNVGLMHESLVWITLAMLALHLGAVFRHQFWDGDGTLYRMVPLPMLNRATHVRMDRAGTRDARESRAAVGKRGAQESPKENA